MRQRSTRVSASAPDQSSLGRVGLGGAFEGVQHPLLPDGALDLQPFVPVGAVAQVEAFEERAAPQVDGAVQVLARARRRAKARGRRRGRPTRSSAGSGRHTSESPTAWIGALRQTPPQARQRGAQAVATFLLVAVLPQQGDKPRARDGLVWSGGQIEHQRGALLRGEIHALRGIASLDLCGAEQPHAYDVPIAEHAPVPPATDGSRRG